MSCLIRREGIRTVSLNEASEFTAVIPTAGIKKEKKMKKLLMFIAVAASACAVNAAALNWGAGVAESDGETAVSADQVAYLVWSSSAFGGLVSTFDSSAMTTDKGGSVVASHTISSYEAGTGYNFVDTFERSDADGGVNGYYQILLTNVAGNQFAVLDAGQVSGVSDSTGAGELKINTDWSGSSFLGDSGYVGTVTGGGGGIPEPTSGLLLLIGGSLLALRRKQK